MKFLFIHQNFPAQFKHLAPALAEAGHDVSALTMTDFQRPKWQGVNLIRYGVNRGNTLDAHPWIIDFETKVIRGEACLKAAIKLKAQGYKPDVIIAHPGWGEPLFLENVWPNAKLKLYCEFFYHANGYDVGFDSEFDPSDMGKSARVKLKNANFLLQSEHATGFISPTKWQASTFPEHIKNKITVVHDGIDTAVLTPKGNAEFLLRSGERIKAGDEVITFVARALEPYRGIHIFLRALPFLLDKKPNAKILIVGKEGIAYGAQPPPNTTWKKKLCDEVFSELTEDQIKQIYFLDTIPYSDFISLLRVSMVHVYITYPFVLSWSLIEAMSVGCAIVASSTPPVKEVIEDRETGLLFDFFNPEELIYNIVKLLEDSDLRARLSGNARIFAIDHYDLKSKCLPQQTSWAVS